MIFFRGAIIIATFISAFGVSGDFGIGGGVLGIIFGTIWIFAGVFKCFGCCTAGSTKVDPIIKK
jgi:hypothetical protein